MDFSLPLPGRRIPVAPGLDYRACYRRRYRGGVRPRGRQQEAGKDMTLAGLEAAGVLLASAATHGHRCVPAGHGRHGSGQLPGAWPL